MSGPRQSLGVLRHSSSRSRGDVGRVGRAGRRQPAAYGRAPGASRHLAHRRHGERQTIAAAAPTSKSSAKMPKKVGSRVTGYLVPRSRRRHPRPGSTLAVLVVAAQSGARFVAPLGGAVEPRGHAPDAVQSARIRGILPALASDSHSIVYGDHNVGPTGRFFPRTTRTFSPIRRKLALLIS